MPNDGQGPEFGMGRRGAGEYGRGQGPNLSRGQTPPPAQGTGAASVLGLGQNKLPQRAEVSQRLQITQVIVGHICYPFTPSLTHEH